MNQPVRREGFVHEVAAEPATPAAPKPAAAPAPAPAPAADLPATDTADDDAALFTFPMTISLRHRAIRNNKNEEISAITFREPTAGDINRFGNPARLNQDGRFVPEEKSMTMVMAQLSGINMPLLERMDPRDWNTCAWRLMPFFIPEW